MVGSVAHGKEFAHTENHCKYGQQLIRLAGVLIQISHIVSL